MESCDEGFHEVLEENSSFINNWIGCGNSENFLKRDSPVLVRSSTATSVEQDVFLQHETDLDGCVVQLKKWNGLQTPVRFLTVCHNIRPVYSVLRKHVKLSHFTASQMSAFRSSIGFQLFYEQGWEGWVAVIPRLCVKSNQALNATAYKNLSMKYFEDIRVKFRENLFRTKETVRRTLAKNDMNDMKRLFVLPDDSEAVITEFDNAVSTLKLDNKFELIQFCFRFGEKSRNGVSLELFSMKDIIDVTVHCAVNIFSEYMELMWSLAGVQSLVENRGSLSSCLSFRDCVCYQSNLDNKSIDVSRSLRRVCLHPEKMRFVQLYVDSPHLRPKTRFHPVSGCIAAGMVLPRETAEAFKRDAQKYISCLDSNFGLMDASRCRIEFVCEVTDLKETINVSDCLCVENLFLLLSEKPMLVPLPLGSAKLIQNLGLWICSSLRVLQNKYIGTGNVEAVWKSFQLELAAEKILWGRPFCLRSRNYSINLGPGDLIPSRSLTVYLGFLALDRWSSCMVIEESIPSAEIWTSSKLVARKIYRSVGLHDVLPSGPCVIGRRLIHVLLKDFYEASECNKFLRYEDFKADLFSDVTSYLKVNGSITCKQLVYLLSRKRRVHASMVFETVCKLIAGYGHELSTVLDAGFQEVKLKYFPAFQNYDDHGNAILKWNRLSGVWKVLDTKDSSVVINRDPQLLSSLVVGELGRRNLVYASRLKNRDHINFPWILSCNRKLTHENLEETKHIEVLTFLSCIAMIMNGHYVDYEQLQNLKMDLPITQAKLKGLELQSHMLLSNFNKFPLYRLHRSFPFQMTSKPAIEKLSKNIAKERDIGVTEESSSMPLDNESVPHRINEAEEESNCVVKRAPLCLPVIVGQKRRWEGAELETLHVACSGSGEPVRKQYEKYKRECLSKNIASRTFLAFKRKVKRIE